MSGLTDDERRVLREYRDTSLTKIQKTIRKSGDNTSLLRYTNWLLNNVLFPLNFFNPSSHPSFKDDDDKSKYDELMGILNDVRRKYSKQGLGTIDLVLFMCGFEPVAVRPGRYEQMKDGIPTEPMLEKTTDDHKTDFIPLQDKGREFLKILLSFGPFKEHLKYINEDKISSNQPHRVVMLKFTDITRNNNFKDIIDQLFITPDESENSQFKRQNNSSYMSELKTKRVMKLFGFSEEESNKIWSRLTLPSLSRRPFDRTRSASQSSSPTSSSSRRHSGRPRSATPYRELLPEDTYTRRGGRRTSRRKQTKSRNPRKRKSTIQRRRKSVKHSKS